MVGRSKAEDGRRLKARAQPKREKWPGARERVASVSRPWQAGGRLAAEVPRPVGSRVGGLRVLPEPAAIVWLGGLDATLPWDPYCPDKLPFIQSSHTKD